MIVIMLIIPIKRPLFAKLEWQYQNLFVKQICLPSFMLEGSNNKISFQKQLGSLVFKNKNCNWSFSIFVKFPCPRFDELDNGPLGVMAAREVCVCGGGVDGTLRCLNFTVNQGQAYPARSHYSKAESVGSCRFQIRLCWSSCWHCVAVV